MEAFHKRPVRSIYELYILSLIHIFKAHGYGTEEALDLVKLSVRLAVQARNEFLEAKANDALTLRCLLYTSRCV